MHVTLTQALHNKFDDLCVTWNGNTLVCVSVMLPELLRSLHAYVVSGCLDCISVYLHEFTHGGSEK